MSSWSRNRGHKIYYNENKREWLYADDDSSAKTDRPCARCGVKSTIFGHDDCLKDLTDCIGVQGACCGHGYDEDAYILLTDGRRFVLDREVI